MSMDMVVASTSIGSVDEAYAAEGRTDVPDAAAVAAFAGWVDKRSGELRLASSPCERLGAAALVICFRLDEEDAMTRVYREAKRAGLRVFDPASGAEG